jgi:UDP-N-acetylmuramyl pentapeptide phosphotransferase/UDP-N-acetylglucosamine-1-phosphate transferase
MARAAIFTLVPALIATALLAWLARRSTNPVPTFLWVSVIVLVLSFIPDYILPVPNRTFTASTIAAFLHVIAAVIIVPILVTGYRRFTTA